MKFEEIYSEAIKYAKGKIKFVKTNLTPEDLVSEAYLICETEITLDGIKAKIRKYLGYYKFDYLKEGVKNYHLNSHETEKQCKRCYDVFPVAMFYLIKMDSYSCYLNTCNECRHKESRIRDKKYYLNNHSTIRQKRKEWYQKHSGRDLQRARKNRVTNNIARSERRKQSRLSQINVTLKSGIRNIAFDKGNNVWIVQKMIQGKRYVFGATKDLENAKVILSKAKA